MWFAGARHAAELLAPCFAQVPQGPPLLLLRDAARLCTFAAIQLLKLETYPSGLGCGRVPLQFLSVPLEPAAPQPPLPASSPIFCWAQGWRAAAVPDIQAPRTKSGGPRWWIPGPAPGSSHSPQPARCRPQASGHQPWQQAQHGWAKALHLRILSRGSTYQRLCPATAPQRCRGAGQALSPKFVAWQPRHGPHSASICGTAWFSGGGAGQSGRGTVPEQQQTRTRGAEAPPLLAACHPWHSRVPAHYSAAPPACQLHQRQGRGRLAAWRVDLAAGVAASCALL